MGYYGDEYYDEDGFDHSDDSVSEPQLADNVGDLDLSVFDLDPDRWYVVEFDGGRRGKSQVAGCGAVVRYRNGEYLCRIAKTLDFGTNNSSEYEGLILGLELAEALGIRKAILRGDSALVINQVTGDFNTNHHHLLILRDKARFLIGQNLVRYEFDQVPRGSNDGADEMANEAMDAYENGYSGVIFYDN